MTTSIRLRVNYLVIIINLGANVKAKNNSVCKHNYSFRKSDLMNSEEVIKESCIVKKDCSKSENMVKYFQESERDEKENELHKGV